MGEQQRGSADDAADLAVVARRDDDQVVLAVCGEVDARTAPALGDAIAAVELAGARELVIDLDGVSFFDSTGVQMVINAHRRASSAELGFALVRPQPIVRRVLEVVGIADFIRDDSR